MRVRIHRGAREIGGSCVEVARSDSRIVLDLGMPLVKFGRQDERFDFKEYEQLSGPELVREGILPDIPGLYSWDSAAPPLGLLISHAHLDHYGLAQFIRHEVPIYASRGTAALAQVSAVFLPGAAALEKPVILRPWEPVGIGPFTVTAHLVDHSAPDALALEIEAEGRKLFYSGDLRAHGRKGNLFEHMVRHPPRDVDVLLLEGTMLGRQGPQAYADEQAVETALIKLLTNRTNMAMVFCSSQNIDRICSIYRAARRTGSTMVIDLYTAYVLDQLKPLSVRLPQHDSPGIRVKYWRYHADKLAEAGHKDFLYAANHAKIKIEEIAKRRRDIVMLAKSNSLLPTVASHLPDVSGMQMVWSMWPGYLDGHDVVRRFCEDNGLDLQVVHTSGHATVEDLQRLAGAVKAKAVVPIHSFGYAGYGSVFANVCQHKDREWFET